MDKKLEMRCKIGAVFEHYAQQSECYRRANVGQRIIMEDRFYWLTMKLSARSSGRLKVCSQARIDSQCCGLAGVKMASLALSRVFQNHSIVNASLRRNGGHQNRPETLANQLI